MKTKELKYFDERIDQHDADYLKQILAIARIDNSENGICEVPLYDIYKYLYDKTVEFVTKGKKPYLGTLKLPILAHDILVVIDRSTSTIIRYNQAQTPTGKLVEIIDISEEEDFVDYHLFYYDTNNEKLNNVITRIAALWMDFIDCTDDIMLDMEIENCIDIALLTISKMFKEAYCDRDDLSNDTVMEMNKKLKELVIAAAKKTLNPACGEFISTGQASYILCEPVKNIRKHLNDGTLVGEKVNGTWKVDLASLLMREYAKGDLITCCTEMKQE